MSNYCSDIVWKRRFGDKNKKAVAAKLADHADEEGRGIWPSIERVAAQCELSDRTVQRVMAAFVEEGILVVVDEGGRGPGSTRRYDFNMERLEALPLAEWGTGTACRRPDPHQNKGDSLSPFEDAKGDKPDAKGDRSDAKGCQPVTQTVTEPSIIKPSPEDSPQPPDERGADAALAEGGSEEKEKLSGKEKHQVEADFHRAFIDWPGYRSASKDRAVERWLGLTAAERDAAQAGIGGYLAICKAEDRKPYAMAGYLKNPEFWQHSAPVASVAMAKPYGKGWGAVMLKRLLSPHAERMSPPTRFMQSLIDKGGDEGRKARLQHLAAHGWPEVNRMLDLAADRRGYAADDVDLALGAGFRPVEVGTALWVAWRDEFGLRGWPWFEASHVSGGFQAQYVYLPDCGMGDGSVRDARDMVRDALAAFEQALAGQTSNNEAAE